MNKQASYGYNKEWHMIDRDIAGISRSEKHVMKRTFATAHSAERLYTVLLSTALKNHDIIYESLVSGTPTGKQGRFKKTDIRVVHAIQIDGEYPENPTVAHNMFFDLYDLLLSKRVIGEGQAIQLAAGGKMIIAIPPLFASNNSESCALYDAWSEIYDRKILPDWLQPMLAKHKLEGVMKFDKCVLTQLFAPTGTWRPTNPKKKDCPELQKGMLRYSVFGDGKRHESSVLQALILEAKEHPAKSTRDRVLEIERMSEQSADMMDEILTKQVQSNVKQMLRHADNYLRMYGEQRGSSEPLPRLGNAMLKRGYSVDCVLLGTPELNAKLGYPYKKEELAIMAMQKAINGFIPYAQTYPKKDSIQEEIRLTRNINVDEDSIENISLWVEQSLRYSEGSILPKRSVYETYVSYCQKNDIQEVGPNTFFRILIQQGYEEKTTNIQGKKTVCYKDITFRIEKVKRQTTEIEQAV